MLFKRRFTTGYAYFGHILLASMAIVGVTISSVHADIIYTQTVVPDADVFASQFDPVSEGDFALVYDNFTLVAPAGINEVSWYGDYFNPGPPGTITQFEIAFSPDMGGIPGLPSADFVIPNNASETDTGTMDTQSDEIFRYDTVLPSTFFATAGTSYWLSIQPTMDFPPQWGWVAGTGGDGSAFQVFMEEPFIETTDFAFTLSGTPGAVPEPSVGVFAAMFGLGIVGVLAHRRRTVRVSVA